MDFPKPVPGLVIRYSYLWSTEAALGREEGVKDRPCAVILVTKTARNRTRVYALPITHSMPANPAVAIEIPQSTKLRLGLDSDRSWIVFNEANDFVWPGPDLRPAVPGNGGSIAYGILSKAFTARLRDHLVAVLESGRGSVISRDE